MSVLPVSVQMPSWLESVIHCSDPCGRKWCATCKYIILTRARRSRAGDLAISDDTLVVSLGREPIGALTVFISHKPGTVAVEQWGA